MGADTSMPLVSDDPFPVHAGPTVVCRTLGSHSPLPSSGPCALPHVTGRPEIPARDAVGRICVQDGQGRLQAAWPPNYVTMNSCRSMSAPFVFGVVRDSAKILGTRVKDGMLAFCVLNETKVMCVMRGSFEEARVALPGKTKDAFSTADANDVGLSKAQLQEVLVRLCSCYRNHGIGCLMINARGFTYQVLVPNEDEYALHKGDYDAQQAERWKRCLPEQDKESPPATDSPKRQKRGGGAVDSE